MKEEVIQSLITAQLELRPVKRDANNPFFNSKYADLEAIMAEFMRVFPKHGFAVTQTCLSSETGVLHLRTTLWHNTGESIEGIISIKPDKVGPQAYGSALTYARRYGLSAICGITTEGEDDDANAATNTPTAKKEYVPKKVETQGKSQEVSCILREVLEKSNQRGPFWILKTEKGDFLTSQPEMSAGVEKWKDREVIISYTVKGKYNIIDDIKYVG